ncbi:uncharacterized protein LOC112568037 isoform X2 [Pomacea canaliculata]|nr:uncharacterized protein LOC112568037 isoform X2 [Pomacea canaliculata]
MSCSVAYQDTFQLSCIFPENVENAFAVFYSPDSGSERMVVNCVQHQELECNNERGFFSKLSAPDRAEITLPESFKKQYGSFRCEIPGLPSEKIKTCQWSPPVLDHSGVFSAQTSEDSSSLRGSSETSINTDDTGIYIGVGIGLFSLVILILVIVILLVKRIKLRRNNNPEEPDNSNLWSKISQAGSREWVPCISPPPLALNETNLEGYYTAEISLSPQQSRLIHTDPPRVFLAGPPGTGKTVVLLLKAIQWLGGGHDVCVVSTGWWSLAASKMLFFLLQQSKKKIQEEKLSPGQVHFLQYNFNDQTGEQINKAVQDLSDAAKDRSLYIIADEARPEKWCESTNFKMFCDMLIGRVPFLYIWASSYFIKDQTDLCRVEYLTIPFRYPSPVLKEVERGMTAEVTPYSRPNKLVHPDGPPVTRIRHQNHSDGPIEDCPTCGQKIANFLHSLRANVTANTRSSGSTIPPAGIHWKDVLLLTSDKIDENLEVVKLLKQKRIPVRVMERDNFINDLATASDDVVWVANGNNVRGLERKVVVCLMGDNRENIRLCHMARCTSQLVIVDHCRNVETEVKKPKPKRIRCIIL